MKRLSLTGFTAAGVLVVAVLGGAVGGALTMSSSPAPAAPAGPVTLHQVADEVTPTPAPSAAAGTSPVSIPAVTAVAPVTTTAPAPVAVVGGSGETAGEAADRAEDAADRAEKAAERVETIPTAPKPAPKPAESTTAPAVEEEPVTKPEPKSDPKTAPKPVLVKPTCMWGQPTLEKHSDGTTFWHCPTGAPPVAAVEEDPAPVVIPPQG